jgi:mono/diheme cytochrome c family protein
VTEIPEHLLKRAQARRSALSGADAPEDAPAGDAPAAAPSGDAPAAAVAPAAPAPLPTLDETPEQAKPDIPVVAAAKRRKRVPYWAASVLALLPVWGILYYDSTIPAPSEETDPLVIGAELFASTCATCHGGDGAGSGAGAQLNDGHAIETFNDPLQMVHWIAFGYDGGSHPDGTYGVDTIRQQVTAGMPAFGGSLTAKEIAAVTIYIRSQFSPDQYDPETEQGFTAETFEADPEALEAEVEAVIEKGEGGRPDLSDIERTGAP